MYIVWKVLMHDRSFIFIQFPVGKNRTDRISPILSQHMKYSCYYCNKYELVKGPTKYRIDIISNLITCLLNYKSDK